VNQRLADDPISPINEGSKVNRRNRLLG